MVKHLKIFQIDQVDKTIVVTPLGESSSFRYRDLHSESNAVRDLLMKPGTRHLIIDLRNMEYFGSEFIGALVSMLREVRNRGGKAYFCSATPQMLNVLQNMSLFKLWPHYESREEALANVPE